MTYMPKGINYIIRIYDGVKEVFFTSNHQNELTNPVKSIPALVNAPSSLIESLDNKIIKSYDFNEVILADGDALASKSLAGFTWRSTIVQVFVGESTESDYKNYGYLGEFYAKEVTIGPLNIRLRLAKKAHESLFSPLGSPYSFNNLGLSVEGNYKVALFPNDADSVQIRNQKTINGWKFFRETASRYDWVGGPDFATADTQVLYSLPTFDDQGRFTYIFSTLKTFNKDGSDLFIHSHSRTFPLNDIPYIYDRILSILAYPKTVPWDPNWSGAISANFPHLQNKIFGIEQGKSTVEKVLQEIMVQTASYFWLEPYWDSTTGNSGFRFYASPAVREPSETYSVHAPLGYTPLLITEDMIQSVNFSGEKKMYLNGRYQAIHMKANYYNNPSLFGLNGNYQYEATTIYRPGEQLNVNGRYLYDIGANQYQQNIRGRLNRLAEKRRVEVAVMIPYWQFKSVLPRLGDMFDVDILMRKGRSPNSYGLTGSFSCFYREILPAQNQILLKGERWEFI